MKKIAVLFVFPIMFFFCSPVSSITLEELVEATEAHWALIQTGRGQYSIQSHETPERADIHLEYKGIWMMRGEEVSLRFTGKRNGEWFTEYNRGPADGEYEFISGSQLRLWTGSSRMAGKATAEQGRLGYTYNS